MRKFIFILLFLGAVITGVSAGAVDVEVNDRRVVYMASSGQTVFDIDFAVDGLDADDIAVYQNGTIINQGADYTVDITQSIITLSSGADNDDVIVVEGATQIERESTLPRSGGLRTSVLNGDFRKLFYILQEQDRDIGRVILFNKSESANANAVLPLLEANRLLGVNGSGNGFSLYSISDFSDDFDFVGNNIQQNDLITYDGTSWINAAPNTIKSALGVTAADASYDNASSGLVATNVQEGIDALDTDVDALSSDVQQITNDLASVANDIAAATPAGVIDAFGGEIAPSGWIECDGRAVSRTEYSALFLAIGTSWGSGDGSTTFNVPDLRGEFLRGWDHGAGIDPDVAARTDRGDGVTGDRVGTKQGFDVQAHNHPSGSNAGGSPIQEQGDGGDSYNTARFGSGTGMFGGNETRPRNAYVMYIIKY